MLRFAADENFNNDIVRGLRRRKPELDIVRVLAAATTFWLPEPRSNREHKS